MADYDARRIADPVHNSIGLSDIELEVLRTPAFQRLRNVKQLGLAYLVFPGADYSRFSHSLGVCHVTGQILEALNRNHPDLRLSDREIQLYRLAGLLHDVGHYPFSHTMEHAIADYYAASLLVGGSGGGDPEKRLNHEEVGKRILQEDKSVNQALRRAGVDPEDVYAIFLRERPPALANLVSSDLDADRIDYLLRTAHHTGLPYGSVDLPYLLSQLRIDNENRICLTPKALRTAEHFLLSRYFDYSQVAFHKTVAALELVLSDVLKVLLKRRTLNCSAAEIGRRITDGSWAGFDDATVTVHIHNLANDATDTINAAKARSIITRNPPKLVWESSYFGERKDTQQFLALKKLVQSRIPEWSQQFGVPKELWWVWDKPGITLTKAASNLPIGSAVSGNERDRDRYEQSIRILNPDNTSRDIMNVPQSLMSVLADRALFSLRLYVLLDPTEMEKRAKIRDVIEKEMA